MNQRFTFIDLFAGVGGFHRAASNLGGNCVAASEWDKFCQKVYENNYGISPLGDITKLDEKTLPDCDLVFGGFPCQSFSQSGKQAGFADPRGQLFFHIVRVLKEKKPKAFVLENVPNLMHHDKGNTIKVILDELRNNLGYSVPDPQVLCAANFGVPQNRKRTLIVGFRPDVQISAFKYPVGQPTSVACPMGVSAILETRKIESKYYLSQKYMDSLKAHRARSEAQGKGFGYIVLPPHGLSNTIMVGGQGHERNLVCDPLSLKDTDKTVNNQFIRKMTPREWARLQGFPDTHDICVSDAQAYKQFGNAVPIPMVQAVIEEVLKSLNI